MATQRDFERVTIRKRKGGRWYARFKDVEGVRKEVCLKLTNKVLAVQKAAAIDKALVADEPWEWALGRANPGERTFRELVSDWLERGSRWSENTRARNIPTINRLLTEFGDVSLSKLNRTAIEGYLAQRRSEGIAKATANRYLCAMNVVLNKGVEWGYMRDNPAADLKIVPEGRKLPRPYREGEVPALLQSLDAAERDLATVYLETALRLGELEKLLWADVDLAGRTLTVRGPKNGRDRVVPLSGSAVRILTERRREWQAEQSEEHADLRVYGSRANIRKAVHRAWHVLPAERCDVLRPVHSFRDTAITRLVGAGVTLPVVQELAGHATIEMTRRYAEVSPDAMREAVTRVFG